MRILIAFAFVLVVVRAANRAGDFTRISVARQIAEAVKLKAVLRADALYVYTDSNYFNNATIAYYEHLMYLVRDGKYAHLDGAAQQVFINRNEYKQFADKSPTTILSDMNML